MEHHRDIESTLRILLIDDDEDDYVWIRRVLASEQTVKIDWASSYEDGCAAIRRHAHDVILVDYRLHHLDDGRDGLDIVRKAREEQATTPCILFTAAPRVGLEIASLSAGAAGFLTKSELSPSRLMHAILQALERGKTESELFQKNRALSLILQATEAANEAPHAKQAFDACLRDVCAELGWKVSDALLISERQSVSLITVYARNELVREQLATLRGRALPDPASRLFAEVLRTRSHVFCRDLAASTDLAFAALAKMGISCALLLPVTAQDEVVALMELYSDEPREPEALELEILAAVAGQLAQTVARSRADAERKRAEAELRQSQRLDALGRLAGGVAHDFNNLLTVITTSAELLLALPPEQRADEPLVTMLEAAHRGARLTRQLLALGYKNVIEPRTVDVNALIRANELLLRRTLREDIALRLDLSAGAGSIEIDPNEFEQLLLNLVLNARDAIEGSGTLTIATRSDLRPSAGAAPAGERYVCLAVHDSGIGMSSGTLEHIFDPFFTTKDAGKGTGLGLSCVYSIVRQAHGTIEVESEPGGGTSFHLYFPARAGQPEAKTQSSDETTVTGGTETILLVEDDHGVRDSAALILESYGYRVLNAACPQDALTIARRADHVDLVLSDVIMPEMGGVELAAQLTKLHPGIPVLFMSGYAQAAVEQQGLVDVAHRVVSKPFTGQGLALHVRRALDDAIRMPRAAMDNGLH